MDDRMLKAALSYHDEGLCVIPIKPRDKAPALATWERYQTQRSTRDEVLAWFSGKASYNIGIVHGEVSGNFVSIDIDDDAGLYALIRQQFPGLFSGRIEQSGSGEGYHIPMRLDELPDFGFFKRGDRPRGNRTWKTSKGSVNVRARFCQTVVPPSIHPSGKRYRFVQKGQLVQLPDLDEVIAWLNEQAPPPPPKSVKVESRRVSITETNGDNLLDAVKDAWPDALTVFDQFGMANDVSYERNGDVRLHDNGGLLIHGDDNRLWYCFEDEIGGDVITAWGWCRYGSAYSKDRHFRSVIVEMAQAAGLDVAQFYRRGDEQASAAVERAGDKNLWTRQYQNRWSKMR